MPVAPLLKANKSRWIEYARNISKSLYLKGVVMPIVVTKDLKVVNGIGRLHMLAAKVAASMCAFIRKSLDALVSQTGTDENGNRTMEMRPGMIFDSLLPGENVGMIESNRPNAMLEQFRNSQLRALAAGTSTSFSSISKDYNGTYSAQRQELVEQSVHYAVLRDYFTERCVRPIIPCRLLTIWQSGTWQSCKHWTGGR